MSYLCMYKALLMLFSATQRLCRTPGPSACNATWEALMAVADSITSVAFSGFPLSSRLLGLSGAITVPRKNRAAKTQAKPRLKRHPQV